MSEIKKEKLCFYETPVSWMIPFIDSCSEPISVSLIERQLSDVKQSTETTKSLIDFESKLEKLKNKSYSSYSWNEWDF